MPMVIMLYNCYHCSDQYVSSYFIIHDEVGSKTKSTKHRSYAGVSSTVGEVTTLDEQCS